MNDPHVVALVYKIEHDDFIDYKKAKSFYRDEKAFRLEVADEIARFEMHRHFPTIEEADKALTEYRRAWEFHAQLERGPDTFHLTLDRGKSELIDRKSTSGCKSLNMSASIGGFSVSMNLRVQPQVYPEPPSNITLNPDVETMYNRYMGYRKGRELLPSMANFCLTVLEDSVGAKNSKRKVAAKKYGIAKRVLNEIGKLTDSKGGKEARKGKGIGKDFSTAERRFLEHAVNVIIHRMAENPSSDGVLSVISMSDMPSLEDNSDS
ncbi:MAG: hypothetical protein F4Y53_01630 [Proteobacteria bacterium]|nr:hypothetical protein [Pseudomonadota bacterium]